MTINRNNYEVFIIDFIDGNLSPALRDELLVFLNQNPDIADEVDGIDGLILTPPLNKTPIVKETLKRSTKLIEANITEADYLCIAELENDLSADEAKLLNELKLNSSISRLSTIYSQTKLNAEKVLMPNKSSLKHTHIIPAYYRFAVTAAGIAAVVLMIFFINNQLGKINSETLVANQQLPATKHEQVLPEQNLELIPAVTENDVTIEPISKPSKSTKYSTTTDMKKANQPTQTRQNEKIEPITSIKPRLDTILENQTNINLPTKNITSSQNMGSANEGVSNAKVITITDIAFKGLQKLAHSVGVEVDVKQSESDKTKKIVVDSKLLAVSATILPKEE